MGKPTRPSVARQANGRRVSLEVVPRPDIIHPGVSYGFTLGQPEMDITVLVPSGRPLTDSEWQGVRDFVKELVA